MPLSSRRSGTFALTAARPNKHPRSAADGVALRTGPDDGRHYTLALRPGTLLDGNYRITQVLAQSSAFAVTYLAQDERAADQVVIKEFLPRTFAGRAADELTVLPYSADDEPTLARTLRRFMREADVLADIAHPNIPRVRRSFEANGTAYLVFQRYEGQTLAEHVAAAGDRLPADLATGLVLQVLHALGTLHAEGIIHGYITPDNILVDANCRALVLGLGTTRHVVGRGREPVAGFAPIEQYAAKEVGPWTDVYACAAVLYRLTTALTPPSAVERSAGQMVTLPLGVGANLPSALAQTVMSALAQLPDTRPHSAEEFRRRLDASLALGAQTVEPRVGHRPNNANRDVGQHADLDSAHRNPRWTAPEPVEPATRAARPEFEPESEGYEDEVVFLTPSDGPRGRVRRLLRLVLGIGGAAAGIVLAISALGRRGEADWPSAGGVSAPPAFAKSRPSPAAAAAPRSENDAPLRPVRARPIARVTPPEPGLEQAGQSLPPSVARREAAPPRAAQSVARSGGQGRLLATPERAPATPAAGPPSVTLTLPSTVGRFEFLPSEVLMGLRERLTHGKENFEYGEYARARRIYRAALDQIAKLGERYAGNQALLLLKQDLEQASGRALVACAAENDVIRRRNGNAVPCE